MCHFCSCSSFPIQPNGSNSLQKVWETEEAGGMLSEREREDMGREAICRPDVHGGGPPGAGVGGALTETSMDVSPRLSLPAFSRN